MRDRSRTIISITILSMMLILAMSLTGFAGVEKKPKNKYSATVVIRVMNCDPSVTSTPVKVSVKAQPGTKITQNFPQKTLNVRHGVSEDYKELYRKTIRWEGDKAHVTVKIPNAAYMVDGIVFEQKSSVILQLHPMGEGVSSIGKKREASVDRMTLHTSLCDSETMYIDYGACNYYTLKIKSTGLAVTPNYDIFLKQKSGGWIDIRETHGIVSNLAKGKAREIVYCTSPEAVVHSNPAFPLQFKVVAKAVNSSYKAKKSEQIITFKSSKKNKPVKKTVTFRFTRKGGSKK